ncbi:DUF4382 domain-containing protein [Chloroflexota bacterium]
MSIEFDNILDECIDLINSGETLEACLAKYPDYAEQIEPLLKVIVQTREAYSFEVSRTAKVAARQRFNTALDEIERSHEERHDVLSWLFGSAKVWAPAVIVMVIALVSFFTFRPILFPPEPFPAPGPTPVTPAPQPGSPSVIPVPQPSTAGNFVFLISDEVNAIGDFQSLNITIEKVGLQHGNKGDQWIEFSPEVAEVDLTQLQGNRAQEIWRGDIDKGQYTKVFIHVSEVNGLLIETEELVSVKLPSEKLQISKPFEVTSESITSFVFDVTVVAAGSEQSGIKYILKPVVGESGADQPFNNVTPKGKPEDAGKPENTVKPEQAGKPENLGKPE